MHGSTATLQVDPGDTITCTYVNKKDATVTVVKDAQPNAAQDFAYTTTGRSCRASRSTMTRDRDAVEHEGVHGLGCGLRFEDDHRVGGGGLVEHEAWCSEGTVVGATATFTVDPGDDDHVHLREQEGRDGDGDQGRSA